MSADESTDEQAVEVTADEDSAVTSDEPEVVEEVTSPTQERDSYRDTLQRVQADFENYRKRVTKQQDETTQRAAEQLVVKLLSVLDTIDLALAHDPGGALEQVKVALEEVLSKEGLERVVSIEQPFDPSLHEAVAHEPGDGEAKVTEEMRAGYKWKGRVIRPAMVKVTGS